MISYRLLILLRRITDKLTSTFPEVASVYLNGIFCLLLDDASNVEQLVVLIYRDL
jgi:hypothetical protein